MSGNSIGAAKAKEKLLAKNPNHYREIGAKGGKVTGVTKGFAYMKEADNDLHKYLSSKGSKISKRKRIDVTI